MFQVDEYPIDLIEKYILTKAVSPGRIIGRNDRVKQLTVEVETGQIDETEILRLDDGRLSQQNVERRIPKRADLQTTAVVGEQAQTDDEIDVESLTFDRIQLLGGLRRRLVQCKLIQKRLQAVDVLA